MDTIIINDKMYKIRKGKTCVNCIFYRENGKSICIGNDKIGSECVDEDFVYVREIKFFKRIKLWFKKKMNKYMKDTDE